MTKKSILFLGASSDIGLSLANIFAKNGFNLMLASRDTKYLKIKSNEIKKKYNTSISIYSFDILNEKNYVGFISKLEVIPDIVVCCVGYLGKQLKSQNSLQESSLVIRTNFLGPVNIINIFANMFEERGSGTIVGLSSVAGERGRASNYLYGASKAGFSAYLSGLRQRLHKKKINVITIKLGYVLTTFVKDKKLPFFLTISKEKAAKIIYIGIMKKRDIVYVGVIWFYIMFILKIIPEKFYKIFRV